MMPTKHYFSLALLLAFLHAGPSIAQVAPTEQAGRVSENCKLFMRRSGSVMLQTDCVQRVAAFLKGWNAGVARGARSAFIFDAANLATTQGVTDVQRRSAALLPAAQCVGLSGRTFDTLVSGYIDFVAQVPSREFLDYGQVLQDYFEDVICKQ